MIPEEVILLRGDKIPTQVDQVTGFVYSQIDGVISYGELLALVPASQEEIMQSVQSLIRQGCVDAPEHVVVALQSDSGVDDMPLPTGVSAEPRQPEPVLPEPETDCKDGAANRKPARRKIVAASRPLNRNDAYYKKVVLQKRVSETDDLYRVLGVSKGTRGEKLQNAFHKLSMVFHPDRIPLDLRDDDSLREDVEGLYNRLREAYDVLSNDERRKSWARERLRGKAAKTETTQQTSNQDAVKIETLLNLVQVEFDKLDLKSARSSWMIARQLDPLSERVQQWGVRLETAEKIALLADRIKQAGYLDNTEKKKISTALNNYEDSILASRGLCSRVFLRLVEFEIDFGLAVRLLTALASGKMTEEEFVSAGNLYRQLRKPLDARKYIRDGLQRFPGSEVLKTMNKEAKRKNK